MTGPVPIIEAAHDKAAVGRTILRSAAGLVFAAGVVIVQPGWIGRSAPVWDSSAGHSLVVRAASNGQCLVDLRIGETKLSAALADTGDDGYVTLGRNQAKQAGIDTSRLRFDNSYGSANGRGRYAEMRVAWVRIGNTFEMADVPVAVTQVDQQQALVGIQVLRRYQFRLRGDRCEFGASA
jgi:clan AA aspartic protease (TIGR02281 family)